MAKKHRKNGKETMYQWHLENVSMAFLQREKRRVNYAKRTERSIQEAARPIRPNK